MLLFSNVIKWNLVSTTNYFEIYCAYTSHLYSNYFIEPCHLRETLVCVPVTELFLIKIGHGIAKNLNCLKLQSPTSCPHAGVPSVPPEDCQGGRCSTRDQEEEVQEGEEAEEEKEPAEQGQQKP